MSEEIIRHTAQTQVTETPLFVAIVLFFLVNVYCAAVFGLAALTQRLLVAVIGGDYTQVQMFAAYLPNDFALRVPRI